MVASKDEFIKAILAIRDKGKFRNTKFRELLTAQYSSNNYTITANLLAEAVGYAIYNAANLQFGKLGHEIANALNYEPPKRKNGEPMWFWTISSGKDASKETLDGQYEFIMRPELVAALEEMKWVKPNQ